MYRSDATHANIPKKEIDDRLHALCMSITKYTCHILELAGVEDIAQSKRLKNWARYAHLKTGVFNADAVHKDRPQHVIDNHYKFSLQPWYRTDPSAPHITEETCENKEPFQPFQSRLTTHLGREG